MAAGCHRRIIIVATSSEFHPEFFLSRTTHVAAANAMMHARTVENAIPEMKV